MFLQSLNRRKNKILRADIGVDEDYKRFRARLEKEIESAIIEGIGSPKGQVFVMDEIEKDDSEAQKKLAQYTCVHGPLSTSKSLFPDASEKIRTSAWITLA